MSKNWSIIMDDVHVARRGMFIDQKGRVIEEVIVGSEQFGCMSRCRGCVYFSRVGALLPIAGAYCNWDKYGLAGDDKTCSLSKFVEVKGE